jgi:hypothetical protein
MFIDKNSIQIKVGNGNYINMGQYIVEARYSYNKLYAEKSGRALSGKMTGKLIGIFPKIILQFGKLTKSQLEALTPIFDSAKQTVRYYDPKKKAYTTMETYTGDYEIVNKYIIGSKRKNEGFQISFIAVDRRR